MKYDSNEYNSYISEQERIKQELRWLLLYSVAGAFCGFVLALVFLLWFGVA